jgi:hypothetical protein
VLIFKNLFEWSWCIIKSTKFFFWLALQARECVPYSVGFTASISFSRTRTRGRLILWIGFVVGSFRSAPNNRFEFLSSQFPKFSKCSTQDTANLSCCSETPKFSLCEQQFESLRFEMFSAWQIPPFNVLQGLGISLGWCGSGMVVVVVWSCGVVWCGAWCGVASPEKSTWGGVTFLLCCSFQEWILCIRAQIKEFTLILISESVTKIVWWYLRRNEISAATHIWVRSNIWLLNRSENRRSNV